ncbi:TlpA family protein disulfide reductase [Candidatus Giovannonibacteria bacterium]|nr:TlpA family protein disulfide reductase [Candidatus Giovannonibacteria bacterium]
MKKSLVIASIVTLSLVGIGLLVISNRNVPDQSDRQTPEKAPDFNLQNFEGKIVRLTDFTGKPLVINSWAAWCPFCRKELVDFAAAQKEFGDKVTIIAIDRSEALNVAKKYTDELGVTNELILLLDPSDNFYQSIGGFSMPETIFIDKNGEIIEHKRGPMDVNEMRLKIEKIL